jgi:ribonucleotide reductase beta subunit family protein with ferritin-like domain
MILEKLVRSDIERSSLLDRVQRLSIVALKTQWALDWLHDDADFAVRLVAFAAIEGIFFSSSFAVIFWFKFKGLMPGVCFSNDLISRDEALHTEFACELLGLLPDRPEEIEVHSILAEAAEIEVQFAEGKCFWAFLFISASQFSSQRLFRSGLQVSLLKMCPSTLDTLRINLRVGWGIGRCIMYPTR